MWRGPWDAMIMIADFDHAPLGIYDLDVNWVWWSLTGRLRENGLDPNNSDACIQFHRTAGSYFMQTRQGLVAVTQARVEMNKICEVRGLIFPRKEIFIEGSGDPMAGQIAGAAYAWGTFNWTDASSDCVVPF